MSEHAEIYEMAQNIREVFIDALETSLGTNQTKGSCAFACYLGKVLFNKFTSFNVFYRGGDGCGDGGYIDKQGVFHGHYWLEVSNKNNQYYVDITADQFGDKPIVVSLISESNQYCPGDQEIIDDHFVEIEGHFVNP